MATRNAERFIYFSYPIYFIAWFICVGCFALHKGAVSFK